MKKTVPVPVETVAALIMAGIAINDILDTKQLTPDIMDELRTIRPAINRFLETA